MADNTVRGVNVELSGDSTKLTKEMNVANREIKSLGDYVKQLDKEIADSFDPADVVLFEKKLETLGTQIQADEKYLEELKKTEKTIGKDLTTSEYNKLQTTIRKTEKQLRSAQKEQEQLNKDIKALNTGNYEEASREVKDFAKKTDMASDSTSSLGDSIKDLDVKGLAGDFIEGGKASEILTSGFEAVEVAGGLAAAGIGLVVLGLKEYVEYSKELREATGYINASINETGVESEKASKYTVKFARTLDMDIAEAAEVTTEAVQDFGDSIKYASDLAEGSLAVIAQNTYGVFDASEAYMAASANTAAFGDDLADANVNIGKSNYLVQEYGNRADDIIDTQNEWSDTFAATGQTSEQMFGILNTGLAAGARNTDEVANAWNEFLLRLGDGTAEEAISSIGLSYDDTVAQFNEGSYSAQAAFLDVVAALFQVEDITKRTALAAEIFGTQGEEMLSVMNLTSEGAQLLADKQRALANIQENVNTVVADGKGFWAEYAEQNGLTAVQVADLKYQIEQQGLSSVDSATKQAILEEALLRMATNAGFTDQEMANLKNTMAILSGEMKLSKTSADEFEDGLDSLKNAGILTQSAFDLLNDAQRRYREEGLSLTNEEQQKLSDNISEMREEGILTANQMGGLQNAVKVLGDNSSSSAEKVDALELIIKNLGKSGELSKTQVKEMGGDIDVLRSNSANATEKVDALERIVGELGGTAFLSQEKADGLVGTLNDLEQASQDGSTSQDDLRDSADDAKSSMEEQASTLEDLIGVYILAQGPAARHRIENQLGKDKYEELTGATEDNAGATEEATQKNKDSIGPLKTLVDSLGTTKTAFGKLIEKLGEWNETKADDKDPEVDSDDSAKNSFGDLIDKLTFWNNNDAEDKSVNVTKNEKTIKTTEEQGPSSPNGRSLAQLSARSYALPLQNSNLINRQASSQPVQTSARAMYQASNSNATQAMQQAMQQANSTNNNTKNVTPITIELNMNNSFTNGKYDVNRISRQTVDAVDRALYKKINGGDSNGS